MQGGKNGKWTSLRVGENATWQKSKEQVVKLYALKVFYYLIKAR
jgi:hypothetical protein